MDIAYSKNNIPIRLTSERWLHIVETHDDLAGYYEEVLKTIEEPDFIIQGYKGALIALREFSEGRFLSVVYKEITKSDGFIITAYFTSKFRPEKGVIVWQQQT